MDKSVRKEFSQLVELCWEIYRKREPLPGNKVKIVGGTEYHQIPVGSIATIERCNSERYHKISYRHNICMIRKREFVLLD